MGMTCELALNNDAATTSDYISRVKDLFTILACTVQLVVGLLDLRHRLQSHGGKHSDSSDSEGQD